MARFLPLLLLCGCGAYRPPAPPADAPVWMPQQAYSAPRSGRPTGPMVDGPFPIGPTRSVVVVAPPWTRIRVRRDRMVTMRAEQVVWSGAGPGMRVEAPLVPLAENAFELTASPGSRTVWRIWSEAPAIIDLSTPQWLSPRLAAPAQELAVAEWIRGGPQPRVDEAFVAEVAARRALAGAVEIDEEAGLAWQIGVARHDLGRRRALIAPYANRSELDFGTRTLTLSANGSLQPATFQELAGEKHAFSPGGGWLSVEVRAPNAEVSLWVDGRPVDRVWSPGRLAQWRPPNDPLAEPVPLRDELGRDVGLARRLTAWLHPDAQVELRWRGAPTVLVRGWRWRPRRLLAAANLPPPLARPWAQLARQIGRGQRSRRTPGPSSVDEGPLERVVGWLADTSHETRKLGGLLEDLAQVQDPLLGWWLRISAAERMALHGDLTGVERLMAGQGAPPVALRARAARLWATPGPRQVAWDRRILALGEAVRAAPDDLELRADADRIWDQETRWQAARPEERSGPDRRLVPAWRALWWPREARPGLTPLAAEGTEIVVPADPERPEYQRRVSLFVLTSRERPGPVELKVGDWRFAQYGMADAEAWQVAFPPGRHTVRWAGPAGATLYTDAPGQGISAGPQLESAWPIDKGRFTLPQGADRAWIRVRLRPVEAGPVTVRLMTDAGPGTEFRLPGLAADPQTQPLDGALTAGPRMEAVVPLPRGARAVWFTSPGERALAQVAWRAPLERPSPLLPVFAGRPGDERERLAEATRRLHAEPRDLKARIERADALRRLGWTGLAREDARRLLVGGARSARVKQLVDRLMFADFPSQQGVGVEAVWPARSQSDPSLAAPVAALRQGQMEGLLKRSDPAAKALVARVTARHADRCDAALGLLDLYLAEPRWSTALALSRVANAALAGGADCGEHVAALYGVAKAAKAERPHPWLDRLANRAARLSRWTTVATDANAGYERLRVPSFSGAVSESAVIRQALLGAPWPASEAPPLRGGQATALALRLTRPAAVFAEAWCSPVRDQAPCVFEVALRGERRTVKAAPGRVEIPIGALAAGRYELSVGLTQKQKRTHLAAVRFRTERAGVSTPVASTRQRVVYLARPGRPVEVEVLGPTTVLAEVRGLGGAVPQVQLTARTQDGSVRSSAATSDAPQQPVLSARMQVGERFFEQIVLPRAVPYRVRLAPRSGVVGVRLAMRVARPQARLERRASDPLWADVAEPWRPAVQGLQAQAVEATPPEPVGAFVAQSDGGLATADFDEAVLDTTPFVAQRAAWSRRLLWFTPAFGVRARQWGSSTAYRVDGAAHRIALGPFRVRLRVGFAQQVEPDAGEWSLRGDLRVQTDLRLHPDWSLRPAIGFGARRVGAAGEPWVHTGYAVDHDRWWRASAQARWRPYIDHLGTLTVSTRSNADLATTDLWRAELGWRGLLRGALEGRLEVGVNQRVADAHRRLERWLVTGDTGLEYSARLSDTLRVRPGMRYRVTSDLAATAHQLRLQIALQWGPYTDLPPGARLFPDADELTWRSP